MRESGRAIQIANTIVETAKQCNLDRDIDLPTEDAADLDQEVRPSAATLPTCSRLRAIV